MIILASASASRRAMLDAAGVAHQAHPAAVDEGAITAAMRAEGAPAAGIALALAAAKALALTPDHPAALVLGGDSVVELEGQLFDKPQSYADAARHLRRFSGQTMTLHSAAVLAKDGVILESTIETARLSVRPLSDDFIADYLDHEWPAIAGCVGCFRMEGRGVQLFDRVEGSHFTIMGMPLLWVLAALRGQGVMA